MAAEILAEQIPGVASVLRPPRLAVALRGQAEQALIQQHELMQQELQMAAEFQRAVLPAAVDIPYLDLAIVYRPYAEVSGDVYDFLQNREGEMAIFLGDATGHGIAAALMTMMIHIGLEGIRRNLGTDESLRRLNRLIAARETGRSVSAVFFRISPGGRLTVTHAGHPSLVVIPADGSPPVQFEKGGCALGVFEEELVPYEEECYQLVKGDKLFAYTDGVIEWSNRDKQVFGMSRLLQCLQDCRNTALDEMASRLLADLKSFSNEQACKDDLTALILEYTGDP